MSQKEIFPISEFHGVCIYLLLNNIPCKVIFPAMKHETIDKMYHETFKEMMLT